MDCDKSYFQLFSLDAALGYTIMGCLLFSFCPVIAYCQIVFQPIKCLMTSVSKTMHSQLDRILNGYWVVKCLDTSSSIQIVSLLMSNLHLHPLLPQIHLPPQLGETQVAVLNRAHLVLQQVLLSH